MMEAYRGSDEGCVASEELRAAHEYQQEAKGQAKGTVHHFLQSWVCGRQARAGTAHREGQKAPKADESTPQNAHEKCL